MLKVYDLKNKGINDAIDIYKEICIKSYHLKEIWNKVSNYNDALRIYLNEEDVSVDDNSVINKKENNIENEN